MLDVWRIYQGSDGNATRELYTTLEKKGPVGAVALNLFRAQKNSARAKVYHGGIPGKGSYRDMAYSRKQWAMSNLAQALASHAASLHIAWGWKEDPHQAYHSWVLYVDIPTGQVSFHTGQKDQGPTYQGDWDGQHQSTERIIKWVDRLLLDIDSPTI